MCCWFNGARADMRLVSIKAVLVRNRTSILAVLMACSIVGASHTLSASAGTSAAPPNPSRFAAYLTPIATKLSPSALAASLPLASTASTKAKDGIIVGTVRVGGGPPSRRRRTYTPVPHTGVVVMSLGHVVLVRTMTRSNGHFSIRIRPGHYLVAGTFSNVCPTNRVLVRPGKIVSTRLSCSIK